jgi:hypothetical protein
METLCRLSYRGVLAGCCELDERQRYTSRPLTRQTVAQRVGGAVRSFPTAPG